MGELSKEGWCRPAVQGRRGSRQQEWRGRASLRGECQRGKRQRVAKMLKCRSRGGQEMASKEGSPPARLQHTQM